MRTLIILLLLATSVFAGQIESTTGYGYFKDADGNVHSKAYLPIGTHEIKDGFTFVEVSNQSKLDKVDVYEPLPTQEQLDEIKIQKEIRKIAVNEIKKTDPTFKDPKDK